MLLAASGQPRGAGPATPKCQTSSYHWALLAQPSQKQVQTGSRQRRKWPAHAALMSRLSLRQRGVLAQPGLAGGAEGQRHNPLAGGGSAGIPGRACARTGRATRLRTARMRLSGNEGAGQAQMRGDRRTEEHQGPTCPRPSMPRCSSKTYRVAGPVFIRRA